MRKVPDTPLASGTFRKWESRRDRAGDRISGLVTDGDLATRMNTNELATTLGLLLTRAHIAVAEGARVLFSRPSLRALPPAVRP